MIQRIQTIYLLLAACAMALCFMFPTATINTTVESLNVQATGELNLVAHSVPEMTEQLLSGQDIELGQNMFIKAWPMMVMALVIIAVALVSMFIFKNRKVQVRVVSVGFLLTVIYVFLVFIWMVDKWSDAALMSLQANSESATHFGVGAYAPIAAVVLLILAQRAIKKDEEKVRAADRLR